MEGAKGSLHQRAEVDLQGEEEADSKRESGKQGNKRQRRERKEVHEDLGR